MDTQPLDRKRILRKPSDIGDDIRRELEKRGLRAPKLGRFSSDWLSDNTENPESIVEKIGITEEADLYLHEPEEMPTNGELADSVVDIPVQDDIPGEAEAVSVADETETEGELSEESQQHHENPVEEEGSTPKTSDEPNAESETLVAIEEQEADPVEDEQNVSEAADKLEHEATEPLDAIQKPAGDEGEVSSPEINENGDRSTEILAHKDVAPKEVSLPPITADNGGDLPETLVDLKAADEAEYASEGEADTHKTEGLPDTKELPQIQAQNSDPTEEQPQEAQAHDRFDETDNPFTMIVNKEAPTMKLEEDLPQTAELDLEILELLDSYQNVKPPVSDKNENQSELIQSLLSTASHELRTPLQTITGFLELLLSGKVTDTQQVEQFMRIAYREGKYLADRIADLEAASQIEAGTIKNNSGKVSVTNLIKTSLHSFTTQTWDRVINFDESNSAELPEIYADKDQLKHALNNVLGIAMRAAPFGGEVFIRTYVEERDIIVQVISGSGELPESGEERLNPTIEDDQVSLDGLGVFVAKNFLANNGGLLQIKGSSDELLFFDLWLPIDGKAEPKGTVLITDDNLEAAEMLGIALQKEGYSPIRASNGLEALEIVANDNVDLVILDVVLPGMDGFEVCYRMRSAPETASIPVVIASAKNEREDQDKALRVGADAYFQKPLVLADLLGSIKDLLRIANERIEDETIPDMSSGAFRA